MTKRVPLLALAVVLVAGNAFLPDAANAQEAVRIEGTITDDGTGEPIEGATVRLADPSGSARETITGPDGAFAFAQVAPGTYTLAVRRLGYEVLSAPLEIGSQAPPRLDVRLQPQAIPLDPLEVDVEGRPPRLAESGFYERMEEGWGVFLEPEWIEANKVGFVRLSDFMSTLQMRAPLPRCRKIPVYLDRRPVGQADGWGTSRSYSLNPAGTARSPAEPIPTLLEELSAYDVGAAELYQPGSKIPFFAWNPGTMTCGAIILWSNWTAAEAEIPKIEVNLCEPAGRSGEVAVNGLVEDEVTQVRLPAAHVFASYANPEDPNGLERVETVVRTDSIGRYRLCDLPADVTLELTAAYGPHSGLPSVVPARAGAEVRLSAPVTPPGSVTGLAVNEVTRQPLEAVRITVDDTDFRAVTDRTGAFSLTGLPPGSYKIRALCGGFDSSVQTVDVAEGAQVRVVLALRSSGSPGRIRCSA
ncbi:carboxypeptidase regulatory-like domain-containing protein [Candidatus Palauibacter sp.]|uniref:carboxypeptidase regulatory-like domain-containing protein n=1 Tax=Candidatus Palauibacter sp. TaxID=3101350 RepID=UPI003D139065